MTEDTSNPGTAEEAPPAEAPAEAPKLSNKLLWLQDPQVAIVQGATLSQMVWRGQGLSKAAAHMVKYGADKGWSFRAAFLNPAKKSHFELGPILPVGDDGVPTIETIEDSAWDAVDLSSFKAATSSSATTLSAQRPPREPRAPRAPRESKPREPRLTGVAPLAMIAENPALYPFLRMGENQALFVTNPNMKRSIRWDPVLTDQFLADFQQATGVPVPLAELETLSAESNPVVVKTRWSRYDIQVTKSEGAPTVLAIQKYRREDAPPPPVVSEESRARRAQNAASVGDKVVAAANAEVAAANAAPSSGALEEGIAASQAVRENLAEAS